MFFVAGAPPDLRERIGAAERWFTPLGAAPAHWETTGPVTHGEIPLRGDDGAAFVGGTPANRGGFATGHDGVAHGGGGAAARDTAAHRGDDAVAHDSAAHGGPGLGRPSLWWLERPPARLADADALLTTSDSALRAVRTGLVAAVGDTRTRLVTGGCGPTALYRATGDVTAYATDAVTAALLAGVAPRVEPRALPELLTFGAPTGGLLEDVAPVPPATVVDLDAGGAHERPYWTRAARWAPVPEHEAHRFTADALLRALDERLRGRPDVWLGLTGGLDSRVVAAALRELGLPVRTYTWGHAEADTAAAAQVARQLGLPHERVPTVWHDERAGRRHIACEVRFNQGLGRMNAFGDVEWPAPLQTLLTGAGGETGRAFWWRGVGRNHADPSPRQAARAIGVAPALAAAAPAVRASVTRRTEALLEELRADGVRGWAGLDVLYAEQRLTQWGRGMLSRHAPSTLGAFLDPDVQRGLHSACVEDRLTDGFHRWFLATHAPELAPPPPAATQRAGVPRPLRRAAARVRAAHRAAADTPLGRAAAGLRAAAAPEAPPDSRESSGDVAAGAAPVRSWPFTPLLEDRPGYAAHLRDHVLGHPLAGAALGAEWQRATQRAFDAADNHAAAEAAITLTGPVALADAFG